MAIKGTQLLSTQEAKELIKRVVSEGRLMQDSLPAKDRLGNANKRANEVFGNTGKMQTTFDDGKGGHWVATVQVTRYESGAKAATSERKPLVLADDLLDALN